MIYGLYFVNLKGLEPPTFWSVARCSIQLSYRSSSLFGGKYNKVLKKIITYV